MENIQSLHNGSHTADRLCTRMLPVMRLASVLVVSGALLAPSTAATQSKGRKATAPKPPATTPAPAPPAAVPTASSAPDTSVLPAIHPANFDSTVSPCKDFYTYVNGGWIKRLKASQGPVNYSSQTRQGFFDELYSRTQPALQRIVEEAWRAAPTATDPVARAVGTFYGSCMSDTTRAIVGEVGDTVRPKLCMWEVQQRFVDALATLYLQKVVPPETQARALALAASVKTALLERIRANPWLSKDFKQAFLDRVTPLTVKVGMSPWYNYANLGLSPTDLRGNRDSLNRHRLTYDDSPVDLWVKWIYGSDDRVYNTRQKLPLRTYAALYDAGVRQDGENTLYISPFVLVAPMIDEKSEAAVQYGGLGSILAHEMTHALASGARVVAVDVTDQKWYKDKNSFGERVRQFRKDQYPPLGPYMQGTSVVEDIADLGGLFVAYDAFEQATRDKPGSRIAGLTPTQQFFVAYANTFRAKTSGWGGLVQTLAPDHLRVNVPLSNASGFARAFGCKDGDPMTRPAAVQPQIW